MSADRIFAELQYVADEVWEWAGFIVGFVNAERVKKLAGKEQSVIVVRIPGKGWMTCKGGKADFDNLVDKIRTMIEYVGGIKVVGFD